MRKDISKLIENYLFLYYSHYVGLCGCRRDNEDRVRNMLHNNGSKEKKWAGEGKHDRKVH